MRSRDVTGEPPVVEFEISHMFTSRKAALGRLLTLRKAEMGYLEDDIKELESQIAKAH